MVYIWERVKLMTAIHQMLLGGRKQVTVIFSANTANGTVSINGLSGYESGQTDINVIVNAGVTLSSPNLVEALTINGGVIGDKVILNNNGVISGGPGVGGDPLGGSVTPANTPALGNGGGVNSNPSGDSSAGNGNSGGQGGAAIAYNTVAQLIINNANKVTGGGGGYGGNGFNNSGGGSGGQGGVSVKFTGTRSIILINAPGAIFGGGGGGGSGWGNRIPGATAGGQTGFAATITNNGGGNFGGQGSAGPVTSVNAIPLFNTTGTFTL